MCRRGCIGRMQQLVTVMFCWVLGVTPVAAHDPVHNLVAQKTKQISACEDASEKGELLRQRADLYRQLRDWDRCACDLNQAQQLDPDNAGVQLTRAEFYWDLGWPLSCQRVLEGYLNLSPHDPRAHELLGDTFLAQQQFLAAASAFGRRIKYQRQLIGRVEPECFIRRAEALAAAGPAYIDEAIDQIERAVTELGDLVSLQQCALEIETAAQRWEGAVARLDRLIAGSKQPATWWVNKGQVLLRAGRAQLAKQSFEQALSVIEDLPGLRKKVPAVKELRRLAQIGCQQCEALLQPAGTSTEPKLNYRESEHE